MKPRPTQFGVRENRSEEHTSELQSRLHLVCRLLLEKKKPPLRSARQCSSSFLPPSSLLLHLRRRPLHPHVHNSPPRHQRAIHRSRPAPLPALARKPAWYCSVEAASVTRAAVVR